MSAEQVVFQFLSQGSNTLIKPTGFSNQVLIYAWGAGGGAGSNGSAGGGAGFVEGIVTVNSGDTMVIAVGGRGGPGISGSRGIGGVNPNPVLPFDGGTTGSAQSGAGGGGGAATVIFVNNVPMIVAAGGGGGSGGSNESGFAGGIATLTAANQRGGSSTDGGQVGGGGGAGYPLGGAGGLSVGANDQSTGGFGGQNFANALVTSSTLTAGSGTVPGGLTNSLYPRASRGYAGYDGAVIVIFTKSFRGFIKDTDWKLITDAYVKVGNTSVLVPTTTTSTTNYSANPSTLGGAQTLIDNIIAGGVNTVTGWYIFDPNIVYALTSSGISSAEIDAILRSELNNDLNIEIAGAEIYSSSEESQTSVTVGSTTYTRGSLAYSGTISGIIPLSGGGTFTWNTTIRVYNFSATTSSTGLAIARTIEGGWKRIAQSYIKEDNQWKSIQSGVSLVPVPSSSETVTVNITIASDTNNYVLSDFLSGTSYNPGRSIVNLTVDAGVIVGSTSAGEPAMIIDGLVTGDRLNLINNGNIAGAGGRGGAAGSYTSVTSGGSSPVKGQPAPKGGYSVGTTTVTSVPGRPGQPGGPALYVLYETTLINNGTIAGGGGGGGGGGGSTGGQGGGGAGRIVGAGANNGTLTAGGAGAGLGGAGGARGTAGSTGTNDTNAGGLAGAPGAAILGVDLVTITTAGTILGEQKVIAREVG